MNSKTLRWLASIIGTTLLLSSCYPPPDKLGELTKTSMQQRFRSDPQFKDSGIEVLRVQIGSGADKTFAALASVAYAGKTYDVPLTVILDGIHLEWFAPPGAFAFLSPSQPTKHSGSSANQSAR